MCSVMSKLNFSKFKLNPKYVPLNSSKDPLPGEEVLLRQGDREDGLSEGEGPIRHALAQAGTHQEGQLPVPHPRDLGPLLH